MPKTRTCHACCCCVCCLPSLRNYLPYFQMLKFIGRLVSTHTVLHPPPTTNKRTQIGPCIHFCASRVRSKFGHQQQASTSTMNSVGQEGGSRGAPKTQQVCAASLRSKFVHQEGGSRGWVNSKHQHQQSTWWSNSVCQLTIVCLITPLYSPKGIWLGDSSSRLDPKLATELKHLELRSATMPPGTQGVSNLLSRLLRILAFC